MTEQLSKDQIFISKLTEIIRANLGNENFEAKELSHQSGINHYSLSRRLYAITNKTVSQFIRETRLLKALEMLQNEEFTVAEVAYKLGFSSPAYFNTCFHEFFGYPPGQIKKGRLKDSEDNIISKVSVRKEHKRSTSRTVIFIFSGIITPLVLIFIFIYPGHLINFRWNSYEYLKSLRGRISLVVIPFKNMSNDSTLNYLKEWIPESMTSYLSNFSEDLQVRQTESIYNLPESKALANNASITPSVTALISKKLDANIIVSGSITETGTGIIVDANLINSKTEEVLKSFHEEGDLNEIIQKIDTLSGKMKDFLIISKLKKGFSPEDQHYVGTSSPEAIRCFLLGQNAFNNGDFERAVKENARAIKIDSNFTFACISLIRSYYNQWDQFLIDSAKKLCPRIYNKRDQMPPLLKLRTEYIYSILFGTPYESIKYLTQLLELDDQQPGVYLSLGVLYSNYFHQYDKAISELEKSFEILNKWGRKPMSLTLYLNLGFNYHLTKQYRKERKLYKKAEQEFPNSLDLTIFQVILSLTVEDTIAANRYLEKLQILEKENGLSETIILENLSFINDDAGILDKAEKYYRQSLSLEPGNPRCMNNFAYFLFNHDRNINEGMELIDKALELIPGNSNYLDTKAWGLYKQGKNKEAIDILEKNWNLYHMYKTYFPLQEVKKAVANQKQ